MAFNVSYLYEIIDKFSPQIKKIAAGARKAEKAISKLSNTSKMLDVNLGKAATTINRIKTQKLTNDFNLSASAAKKLNAATGIGAKKLEKLNKAIRNTPKGQNLITLSKRSAGMAASVARTNTQLGVMKRKLIAIKATDLPLKTTSFAPVTAQVNRLTMALSRARSQADSLRGQLFDTAAAAFIFTRPIKAAIDFESVMADVKKVVDFKTPKQFAEMEESIKRLGISTSLGAEGLAKIVAEGGKVGLTPAQLPDFALIVAKASVAFDLLPEVAGKALSDIAIRFKIPIDQIEKTADAINFLSDTTAARAPDMINILSRISGSMANIKMPPELAAGFAAFANQLEVTPELAASGINQMLSRMNRVPELQADLLRSPQKAIVEMLKTLNKLDVVTRTNVIRKEFGEEAGRFLLKAVNNIELLTKTMDKVADKTKFAGSMTREFEIRQKTAAKSLARLGAQFNVAAINLTTGLLPSIVAGSAALAGITGQFASFAAANPGVMNAIMLTIGGLITLRIATIAAMFSFTQFKIAALQGAAVLKFLKLDVLILTPAMKTLRALTLATALDFQLLGVSGGIASLGIKAMAAAATVAKFAIKGLLIATGIGALLVGLGLLVENWDLVKQKTIEYFNIAKTLSAPAISAFNSFGNSIGSFVFDLIEKFPILSQFGDVLVGMFSAPLQIITTLKNAIADLLPSFETLKNIGSFLIEKGAIGLGALTGGALGTVINKVTVPSIAPAVTATPSINAAPALLSPVIAKQQMNLSGNITVGATQNSEIREAAFTSDFGNLGVNIE